MKKVNKIAILFLLSVSTLFSLTTPITLHNNEVQVQALDPASGASYYADNVDNKYYQGIDDNLTGEALMVALSTLTSSGFVSFSYGSLASIYQYSDRSLENSGLMQMVYTGSLKSFSAGSMPSGTNKEHVWPASWYGNDQRTEGAGTPGSDAHNVWPSASELNSKRGTAAYDELDFASSYKAYEFNRSDWSYGTPGDNDSYVWTNYFDYTAGDGTKGHALYPSRGHRGAVARILMYVATRYRNDSRFPVMLHDKAETLRIGRIGKLSTLLKWHYEEPPSAWEIRRNNEIAARYHHNRNPFIDHPEYASKIFYYLPEPGSSSPTSAVKSVIETYSNFAEGISLNKTSLSLAPLETFQLNVIRNPNNELVTWSSSDETIASVSSSGLVSAHKLGNATIFATGEQSSASVVVTIKDSTNQNVLMSSLSFNPTSYNLQLGNTLTLKPIITPSDTTNKVLSYEVNDSSIVTISEEGVVTALNTGSTSITARSTDGSNKSAIVTINVSKTNLSGSGWTLVNDAATLKAGDEIVIAANEKNVTAGGLTSDYLAPVTSTFSSDKSVITSLHASTTTFTLGGSSGNWTLTSAYNEKLGAIALKKLGFDQGTLTWDITINENNVTIQCTTNSYGRILFNVGAPRFNTYTSTLSSSMLLPQLYRYTAEEVDNTKSSAHTYISEFMNRTGPECASGNVLNTTWSALKDTYSALNLEVKDYFYLHAETDVLVVAFIARYRLIIENYGYDNFLVSGDGTFIINEAINNYQKSEQDRYRNLLILSAIMFIGVLFIFSSRFKIRSKSKV